MAVTYGFYNSLNGDRKYNAEDISHIFNGIITDGVFSTIGDTLMTVAGTGMQVIVKTGKCWFNGTWTMNDSLLPLSIEAADVSLTRIDAVVVEVDTSVATRANSIKIVRGTTSANPANPPMKSEEFVHQYPIAYVTVSPGVTSITADKININVGRGSCPFITSVLQQADIGDIFNAWETEFDTWFQTIKNTLSGDVAANLMAQITAVSDKADSHLSDYTRELIGLGSNAGPDEAFLALFVGIGKMAYKVTVKTPDGRPVAGSTISGLTAITGRNLVTNSKGQTMGISTSSTVTIYASSPYFDCERGSVTVTSTGTVTNAEITLPYTDTDTVLTLTSSKAGVIYRSTIKSIDITEVGGGSPGEAVSSNLLNGSQDAGKGGNGGKIATTKLQLKAGDSILVGVSGSGNNNIGVVKKNDSTIAFSNVVTQAGGNSGSATYTTGTGDHSCRLYSDDASDGAGNTIHVFDDTTLGYAGSGAGGGSYASNRLTSESILKECISQNGKIYKFGGSPKGGNGGFIVTATSSGAVFRQNPTSGAFPGGGGGGGCAAYGKLEDGSGGWGTIFVSPGSGASGCAYIRLNTTT